MLRPLAVLGAALLLILPGAVHAQAALAGIVRDDSTTQPLAGVEILIQTTNHRVLTTGSGRYELTGLPAGVYQLIFRQVGYLPVRMDVLLRDGETTRANAVLVRSEVILDPIVVTGEMPRPRGNMLDAFEERRDMGFGSFIDHETMRESEHLRLTDVLRRHSRVEVRHVCLDNLDIPEWRCPGERGWLAFNPTRRNVGGQLNCPMHVMHDGHLVTRSGWLDLRRFVSINELHAAEVYQNRAQLPIQFSGVDADCGMIVLWTRQVP